MFIIKYINNFSLTKLQTLKFILYILPLPQGAPLKICVVLGCVFIPNFQKE